MKREKIRLVFISYLTMIIGLPIVYSLNQRLPIFGGFTDTWWQMIICTAPISLIIGIIV